MHLLQTKTYSKAPLVEIPKAQWLWLKCDDEGRWWTYKAFPFSIFTPKVASEQPLNM